MMKSASLRNLVLLIRAKVWDPGFKKLGFFKKAQPSGVLGFYWVSWFYWGFFGQA